MKIEMHVDKSGEKYWTVSCNGPLRFIQIEAETRSEAFYQALIAINEQAMSWYHKEPTQRNLDCKVVK